MRGYFATIARAGGKAAVLIAAFTLAACAMPGMRDNAGPAMNGQQYGQVYQDQYYGDQSGAHAGMQNNGYGQQNGYGQYAAADQYGAANQAGSQYSMQDYQSAYDQSRPQQQMVSSRTSAETGLLQASPEYVIGPMDELNIFVWRAPELSGDVTVRPDGRISTPLVQDMQAAGKTPTELAADVQRQLGEFVRQPEVTVRVKQFSSTFAQQVRVLGEAQRPVALPYQAGMTVLDVMVAVGGLTEFAAGNRAVLIRGQGDSRQTYRLRLDDLMRRAEVKANAPVLPGDVILIPESIF